MAWKMIEMKKSSLKIMDSKLWVDLTLIYLNNGILIAVYRLFKTLNYNGKCWFWIGGDFERCY